MAVNPLRKLYAPEYLIRPEQQRGAFPSVKQVYGHALSMAGPSVVEFFLISLIMMADTLMVSAIGPEAIAAVGIAIQPRFIAISLVLAMNVGVTAITARRFGEQNHHGAVECLKQSLLLSLGISVLVAVLSYRFARPILLFAGAQADAIDLAQQYFQILMIGVPANCIALTVSAALRGIGQTKAPMIINMTANLINVFLNYMLIGGNLGFPRLEVKGAAIATVTGWTIGLLMALTLLVRKQQYFFVLERQGWRFDIVTLRAVFKISVGAFMEQICMRIGFFAHNKIMANLGTVQYATHQICLNILSLSFSVGEGLSLAAASLVGQNLGAKRPDLSVIYGKALERASILYSLALMLLFTFFGRPLMRFFSNEGEIVQTGGTLLFIGGILVLFQCGQMIYMGCLRGAGDTMYVAVLSMISIMLIRPVIAYSLAYPLGLGLIGGWLSFLVDQIMRYFATYFRFSSGKWMHIKI